MLTSLMPPSALAGLSSFLWAKSMRRDLPMSSTPLSSVTALDARSGEAKSTCANPLERPDSSKANCVEKIRWLMKWSHGLIWYVMEDSSWKLHYRYSPVSLSVAILTLRAVPCPRTPSHMSRIDASVTPKSGENKVEGCESRIRRWFSEDPNVKYSRILSSTA